MARTIIAHLAYGVATVTEVTYSTLTNLNTESLLRSKRATPNECALRAIVIVIVIIWELDTFSHKPNGNGREFVKFSRYLLFVFSNMIGLFFSSDGSNNSGIVIQCSSEVVFVYVYKT